MAAQFPAKCVADLGDDFDFGRMVKLGIFELVDSMLVIDRIGGKMNEVVCVVTEQPGGHETPVRVHPKFTKPRIIAGQVELADVAALDRSADQLEP